MSRRRKSRRAILLVCLAAAGVKAQGPPAGALPGQDTVELPPMLVEAESANGPEWRYGRVPGVEVLSACDTALTRSFIVRLYEQEQRLRQFIPPELLVRTTAPMTVILYPKSREKSLAHEMAQEMEKTGVQATHTGIHPLPHLRLTDADSSSIYAILDDGASFSPARFFEDWTGGEGNYSHIVLAPEYLGYRLESNPPDDPPWFCDGMVGLYRDSLGRDGEAAFAGDEWLSAADADALQDNPDTLRPILPLAEVFVGVRPNRGADYLRAWRAEAELFCRWAAAERRPGTRAALWEFAERARRQPVTEGLFRQYFGIDYADMRDVLSDYLPTAVTDQVQWDLGPEPAEPAMELHLATPSEIHRIKGDWSRRALRLIRTHYPKLVPLYVDQTRRLFEAAYARGERDPLFLAGYGLFDCELGQDAAAGSLLENAHGATQLYPRDLAELARLRLGAARAHPAGMAGTFSPAQVSSILALVNEARQLSPPLVGTYAVVGDLVRHVAGGPSPEEIALLNEGARLFPYFYQLVLDAVVWDTRTGDLSSAKSLAALGAWNAADPAVQARFAAVQRALAGTSTR
jgi:hypothetical protein